MNRLSSLHFYPERIAWIGLSLLVLGTCLGASLIFGIERRGFIHCLHKRNLVEMESPSIGDFSFGLKSEILPLSAPHFEDRLIFILDPPRPDRETVSQRCIVKIPGIGSTKKVDLPCQLPLCFEGIELLFGSEGSPLWMELSAVKEGSIQSDVFILEEKEPSYSFVSRVDRSPIQSAHEFPPDTPFQILGEMKWLGQDQLCPLESGERLERAPNELLELRKEEWLVFKDGKWEKSLLGDSNGPIARIESVTPKSLVLEGWDESGHVRLGIGLSSGPPFKVKTDDFLTAIRVRSEKQVSCMLEKQCMVLKVSDWVLKNGSGWKILRKSEERAACVAGGLVGELFILDKIIQKQGQNTIQGRLFNTPRTQVIHLELIATGNRKSLKNRRGKA
ncbi:MAG: hypothetical protein A3D96_05970 [Chlamydiae bacterium RIFCSPHIGHO2_12_FULL_44_59]|nr:MAG: hypothetical protein A3C42_02100 [Chlamydiae bacterium RIFCSPHIGHO2_02_FULL_45_9]OGN61172.1 MAG: hypothetical protein A3D96_05970 [Chlamydiae bacterium RIFCSPHIGHO2_12_FULL_44_59]OGN68119.1 MAG: hypothetical protein A3I67_05445 [Chlamydiae bacterium RIFCSPLOWO2_02_FULL_45_22]